MTSPLEQFTNHYLGSGASTGVAATTLWVTLAVNAGFLQGVLWSTARGGTGVATVTAAWWSAIAGVARQQLGSEQRFHPVVVYTFGWVALHNVVGLIPGGFTPTAHLAVTLFLGLGLNLGLLYWGVLHHGVAFLKLFVPSGAPVVLLPLLVVIELVSYAIRPISLSLRLFANMMAGHTLVHILLGFASAAGVVTAALASAGIFAVTLLEFGIAFLQAYVFVVLVCIYARDALEPGH